MRHRPDRLFLLTGGTQGFSLAWGLPAVVWWVVQLALSPIQLVLLGTALVVTILVAEVPTGVVADLYSRKRSVVAAYIVMGAAMSLAPIAETYWLLLVWQVLWGIGWTLQSGAATAWMTDELAFTARAQMTDHLIVRHAIWRSVGVMAGILVAGALGVWSLRGSMVVMGGATALMAAFLAVTMSEAGFRPARGGRGHESAECPPVASTSGWRDAARLWTQGARLVRQRPTLLAVVLAAALAGAASEAVERLDVLRLVQLGLADFDGAGAVVFFGAVWFVMSAMAIPAMVWLARHVQGQPNSHSQPSADGQPSTGSQHAGHHERRRDALLLARLLLVVGIGTMALAISPSFAVALGGWAVLDVAGETTYPLAEAMANREAPSMVRATVISFLGQAEAVGEVVGGLALGAVARFVSVPLALAIAASVFAISASPVALVARRSHVSDG